MNRFFQNKLDIVLFWTLTVFFHAYTRITLISKAGVGQFLLEIVFRNVLLFCAIYPVIHLVIPPLMTGKKIIRSLLILSAVIVFYVILKNSHDLYLYGGVLNDSERKSFFFNTLYNFSIVLFYLAFATALHLSKAWYLQQELIRKLEVEKLNTELEYLRAQINPHFLFNSINTIYFQIDRQNKVARETLNKFSDMLRYQLYECNADNIEIEKEINYLDSYVNLQRLRMAADYPVKFVCSKNLSHFSIPPLLLIPFVENAFKHASHYTGKNNEIDIQLSKEDNMFNFSVVNTIDCTTPGSENEGIGLKNVKRRLALLYRDAYRLDIKKTSETFSVTLKLPIA
ncbi:MAG: histidine kinase [Cyclobacteriaceae bacterium]|nr:histidine kinase [Cyclobacteriaceae bacterium]